MKLKKVLTTAITLSLSLSLMSSCNENTGGKVGSACLPPEKVDKEKIKQSFSIFARNQEFDIEKVERSPVDGLYKVIIKSGGRYGVVYIDCKLEYAVVGSIIEIKSNRNLTRETAIEYQLKAQADRLKELEKRIGEKKFEELKKILGNNVSQFELVDLKGIPKDGVIIYGNPNAKYTVYIISDPECPFCARLHQSIKEILNKDKDVKFEIILFPLPFHKYAKGIAENIASQSDMEKRKEILDKSFEAVSNRNPSELEKLSKGNEEGAKILEKHKAFSKSVNLRGTPMIIFPEGIAIGGAIPTETFYQIIEVLKK
ncbi:MAG: DsbC family protein [Persephonella sp.]|nr:MAG: DsbC family protein [Persephonella sp.]RUM61099.1 MAG: DsbC family protein [Persephonella sp.]